MTGHDILIIVGIMAICSGWLDIFNISLFIKKVLLGILMFCALYAGYINFPDSADFGVYNVLYFSNASDQFVFPELKDGIIDYGFLWLWTVIKSFGGDIYSAYVATCALTLFFYYISISKYTSYILTVWSFIYVRLFYTCNVIQIRQGLAMSIILVGLQYVEKKCFWKFLLFVIVASLIHKTVLVTILLYPLSMVKWNEVKIFISVAVSTVISFLYGKEIFFFLVSAMGIGLEKLYAYQGSGYFAEASNYVMLVRGVPILLCVYYLIRMKKEKYANLFISMLLCGYLFLMVSKDLAILGRFTSTFLLCMNFIPIYLFRKCSNASNKIVVMFIISILLGTLFVKNLGVNLL